MDKCARLCSRRNILKSSSFVAVENTLNITDKLHAELKRFNWQEIVHFIKYTRVNMLAAL